MDLVEFWTICSANGIMIDEEQREQIKRYCKELIYWNQNINMISRKDEENILDRHILHSMSILKYYNPKHKAKCLDIGSGGGLPGIPLKIARPDLDMTLVDSISKKVKMLKLLSSHTGMKKIKAVNSRAENLSKEQEYKGNIDVIFARGVARIAKLYGWVKPLLKNTGEIVLLKGGDLGEEIEEAKSIYPDIEIELFILDIFGYDKFKNDDKKLIVIRNK